MNNITLSYSQKETVMQGWHKQIMQFKNWLLGTNHHSSGEYFLLILLNMNTDLREELKEKANSLIF